jgi:DNA end-binding protein Ku
VTVTEEEFGALPVKTLHTIDVAQFVAAPVAAHLEIFARQPYYLAPEALGRRAYGLLCATLEDTGLAAIAKIAIRDREHVATVRPLGDGLLLTTLAWPQEVRPISQLDLPAHSDVPPAELRLARDLVMAMARPFDADEYRDEYAEALGRLLESKAAGAAFALPSEAPSAALVDLMTALEASVAAAVEARGAPTAPTPVRDRTRPRRRPKAPPASAA